MLVLIRPALIIHELLARATVTLFWRLWFDRAACFCLLLLDGIDEVSDRGKLQFSFGGTHAFCLVLLDLLDDWLVLAVVGEDVSQWARPTTNLTLGVLNWWAFFCLLCFSFLRCSWEIRRERFRRSLLAPLLILMLAAIEFNLA